MTKLLAVPYTQTVNKYTLHLHMNTLQEYKKGFRAKSCKSSLRREMSRPARGVDVERDKHTRANIAFT